MHSVHLKAFISEWYICQTIYIFSKLKSPFFAKIYAPKSRWAFIYGWFQEKFQIQIFDLKHLINTAQFCQIPKKLYFQNFAQKKLKESSFGWESNPNC